jgi:hypothetical protein
MKKFKITASYTHYCTAEINAENLEQAEAQARDMDGGSFTPSHTDDWKIERVDEVVRALTLEQVAFLDAYGNSVANATRDEVVEFLLHDVELDGDAFCDKHGTGTYSSIMDARMVWLNALNFADRKAAQ